MSAATGTPPFTAAADLFRRVQQVELRARRLATELLAGPYRSIFRGRGLEFEELREYQPGDDVRSIDWHASARSGTVQLKQNMEDRCLTVMLTIDLSASGEFGSCPQSKRELMAELAAVFALSAVSNQDRVGLAIFTDNIERYIPPRPGRRHALAILAAILEHQPRSRRTSISAALRTLGSVLRRRSTVFLISDFIDQNFERALRLTSLRHEVVAITVHDPAEQDFPDIGWVACEDSETGEAVEVLSTDPAFRHGLQIERHARNAALDEVFRKAGVDRIACETGTPYQRALLRFFDRRQRMAAGVSVG